MEEKNFEFFRKLVEIFAIFGASPVSTTPVKQKKIWVLWNFHFYRIVSIGY